MLFFVATFQSIKYNDSHFIFIIAIWKQSFPLLKIRSFPTRRRKKPRCFITKWRATIIVTFRNFKSVMSARNRPEPRWMPTRPPLVLLLRICHPRIRSGWDWLSTFPSFTMVRNLFIYLYIILILLAAPLWWLTNPILPFFYILLQYRDSKLARQGLSNCQASFWWCHCRTGYAKRGIVQGFDFDYAATPWQLDAMDIGPGRRGRCGGTWRWQGVKNKTTTSRSLSSKSKS